MQHLGARWPAAAVLVVLAAGCGTPAASVAPSAAAPVHWAYEGEAGPDRWAELSADFAACAAGRRQSPIDIARPSPADLANVAFDYRPARLEIVNNGHTVQVNYPAGSSITLDGAAWQLLQFHFHAPSEHHVEGRPADAELHLVHRADDGRLAVVGVLLAEGAENAALAPVFGNLPAEAGSAVSVDAEVDAAGLLPATQTTYRYSGSLTTPPCTEGVSWLLMTEPVEVSTGQLAAFRSIIEGNNRPLQPPNDRALTEDTTP